MEKEMKRIALTGDIDAFYGVIEREPGILKSIEEKDFVETPLHVAASVGNTDLAVEILSLKPSFGKKLNPSGYSPLDLALRNGHRETIKQLIKFDAGLIGVRSRERKTPLHYAAENDDAHLVAEFLVAYPTAIKEVTIRGETAAHLAVLRGSLNAFKVLVGWTTRTDKKEILSWKDNKGNTVLHIAAQTRQVEVIRLLIKEKLVELNERNEENQTALEIVSNRIIISNSTPALPIILLPNQDDVEIQKSLQEAGAWELSKLPNLISMVEILTSFNYSNDRMEAKESVDRNRGMTIEVRNTYLVVTVLILAATFQAVLSPPGGGWASKGDDINSSSTTLLAPPPMTDPKYSKLDDGYFALFITINSITFVTSLVLTVKLLMPNMIQCKSGFICGCLGAVLVFLTLSYMVSGFLVAPPVHRVFTFVVLIIIVLVFSGSILIVEVRRRKLLSWIKKDIFGDSVYKMEQKVRQGKYVA